MNISLTYNENRTCLADCTSNIEEEVGYQFFYLDSTLKVRNCSKTFNDNC